MYFRQNKYFWLAIFFSCPLLIVGYSGIKTMTSVYNQDFGNGVIVYADDFVNTGKWVFDCTNSRLISRQPLQPPIAEIENAGKLTIGNMYSLSKTEQAEAIEAIKAITNIESWHKSLRYHYSSLDQYSDLNVHTFDLLARHNGQAWALKVWQSIVGNKSSFEITAQPYDPEHYMDHAKMLKAAAASCPTPQ
ncbi:hypothetical protein SAMN03159444_02520 [Pseudomonas sp. NFACC02]|jgi:hypothetical protein|uniref:hypothetical protein n=1 Tax=Pseudomonas TaxID=286 RepID=UPI000781D643|nr:MULTISPECIES: hypothetical protein [Pseudomonas]SEQ81475.1 hypothetical protein SAMN03159444_02520 [Pseudomonas sp. NFACC02]